MKFSVCTTNYQCAHSLKRHLESVFENLSPYEFEYIVVDNRSRDGSLRILESYAEHQQNMTVLSKRCTMGTGREVAFSRSRGEYVMVLDTDVVYSNLLTRFAEAYLRVSPEVSVQAIFCGIFPREQWIHAGGRRSLNTNEDLDLWIRIWKSGTMRWYPVPLGSHMKEPWAEGSADYRSVRYAKREKVLRLLRREWDFFKTRKLERLEVTRIIAENTINLGMGTRPGLWPVARLPRSRTQHLVEFGRELKAMARNF